MALLIEVLLGPFFPILGVVAPLFIIVLIFGLYTLSPQAIIVWCFAFGYVQDVTAGMQHGLIVIPWLVVGVLLAVVSQRLSIDRLTQQSVRASLALVSLAVVELLIFVLHGGLGAEVFGQYIIARFIVLTFLVILMSRLSLHFYKRMAG